MAEATLTETEVTPPNDAAVATPESPPESVAAPENAEDTSAIDEIVSRIGSAFTQDAGEDGNNAAPDGVVPPARLSEAEVEARVRAKVDHENRFKGLKSLALESGPAALAKFADRLDPDEQREFNYIVNQIKGAVVPLADRAVDVEQNYAPVVRQAALKEAEDWTVSQLTASVKEVLGEAEAKAFSEGKYGSWQDVGKSLFKAARKGYVPAERITETLKSEFAKYDQALKERGSQGIVTTSLAQLSGGTGPDTPAATGGSGGNKSYTNMTPEERAKLTPEQRDELIARQFRR